MSELNEDSFGAFDDEEEIADNQPINVPYATTKLSGKSNSCAPITSISQIQNAPPDSSRTVSMKKQESKNKISVNSIKTAQPKSPSNFHEKAYKEYFIKEQRLLEDISEAWKAEMQQFSFTPEVTHKTSPRGFKEFIEDQNKFVQEKLRNIEELKKIQEIDEKASTQKVPKIGEVFFSIRKLFMNSIRKYWQKIIVESNHLFMKDYMNVLKLKR